jgi:hypothetical protein
LEKGPDGLQPSDLKPGEELVKERRDTLVNRLANLTITGLLGAKVEPEYGLEAPTLRCTVELDSGAVIEYTFGQPPQPAQPAGKDGAPQPLDLAGQSLVLKVSTQEQLVRVDGWQVDELNNTTRSSLVRAKTPPPATTAPQPAPAGQAAEQAQ